MPRYIIFLLFLIPAGMMAQGNSSRTMKRLFISIPDSFYAPLERQLPDTLKITKEFRASMMMDTAQVPENSFQPFSITVFDTVNHYMRLLAKTGDPEGMWSEISYWEKKDGKNLSAISEYDILPEYFADNCIAPAFYKKHPKAKKYAMPYELVHDDTTSLLVMNPQFDYLFSCEEYFKDDPWYGLTEADIVKKQVAMKWNGEKFEIVK